MVVIYFRIAQDLSSLAGGALQKHGLVAGATRRFAVVPTPSFRLAGQQSLFCDFTYSNGVLHA